MSKSFEKIYRVYGRNSGLPQSTMNALISVLGVYFGDIHPNSVMGLEWYRDHFYIAVIKGSLAYKRKMGQDEIEFRNDIKANILTTPDFEKKWDVSHKFYIHRPILTIDWVEAFVIAYKTTQTRLDNLKKRIFEVLNEHDMQQL